MTVASLSYQCTGYCFFFRRGICSVLIISGIWPSPVRLEFVAAAVWQCDALQSGICTKLLLKPAVFIMKVDD